jgi:predicted lysophospholipase L1 biosynthesis ABC-type transport system permease subunit
VTAWLHLAEAQELLNLKGRINAILALECVCAAPGQILAKVREELAVALPDTQVIERGTAALARAEARVRVEREAEESVERERRTRETLRARFEGIAAVLLPLVWIGCAVWIALLAHGNVSERRAEIGLLSAIGWSRRRVLGLFLGKLAAVGLAGGALGVAAVVAAARAWVTPGAAPDARLVLATLGGAVALALIAGWLPVFKASLQDPANTLRGHEG